MGRPAEKPWHQTAISPLISGSLRNSQIPEMSWYWRKLLHWIEHTCCSFTTDASELWTVFLLAGVFRRVTLINCDPRFGLSAILGASGRFLLLSAVVSRSQRARCQGLLYPFLPLKIIEYLPDKISTQGNSACISWCAAWKCVSRYACRLLSLN